MQEQELAPEVEEDLNDNTENDNHEPEVQDSSPQDQNGDLLESIAKGETDFFELPYADRDRIKAEIKQNLPEDAQRAMELGWTPKEMFRGKYKDGTDKPWVDHQEFLSKIEKEAPVRNERIRTVTQERDSYKEEISALQKQLKLLTDINRSKMERDLLNEESLTEKELAQAREDYDFESYDRIKSRKESLEQEKLKLKQFEQPPLPPAEPMLDPDVQAWAAENEWIVRDPTLLKLAQIKDQELELMMPNLSKRERFNLVSQKIGEEHPLKNPKPRQIYQPTKGNATFGKQARNKTFNDLPAIEKTQALELIEKGVWKDKADFLKTYNWD